MNSSRDLKSRFKSRCKSCLSHNLSCDQSQFGQPPHRHDRESRVEYRSYSPDYLGDRQSNLSFSISRIYTVTQTYQAQVYVTLRPSVLDPAGTAVQSGLAQLGFEGVDRLRIGKYIELTIEAADEASASQQLDAMCDRLLANTTIENYRFDLKLVNPSATEVVSA